MAKLFKRGFFLIVLSSALIILYVQITKYNELIVTNSSLVYITENEKKEAFYTDKYSGAQIKLPSDGYSHIYPSRSKLGVQYLSNNLGFTELVDGKVETYYSDLEDNTMLKNYVSVNGENKSLFEGSFEQDGVMYIYSVYPIANTSYLRVFNTKTKEIEDLTIKGVLHSIYYSPDLKSFVYVSNVDKLINSLKVYKGTVKLEQGLVDKPEQEFTIPGFENIQITAIATEKGVACITCGQAEQYITDYVEKDGEMIKGSRIKLPRKYHFYEQLASIDNGVLIQGKDYVGYYNGKTKKGSYVNTKGFDGTSAYQFNNSSFTYIEKNKVLNQSTLIKKNVKDEELEKITIPLKPGETIKAFNLPD